MSKVEEMGERHGAILRQLADRGLALACKLSDQAMEAESVEETERLALVFHRVSRSVRQSLALETKLAHDRHEVGRLDRLRAFARTGERKDQVRAAVGRLVWTEREGLEAESLMRDLDARLREEALDEAFPDTPAEILITRIARLLGLAANDAGQGEAGQGAAARPDVAPRLSG